MRWAQEQRINFINQRLAKCGQINRSDLVKEYRISVAQAAIDFRQYLKLHPGKMTYDPRRKTYVRTEKPQPMEKQKMGHVDSTSDDRTVNNTMRHQYRVLTEEEKMKMAKIKDMALEFHEFVAGLGESRELSQAKTKIEEAAMWGVKHITK